MYNDGAGILAAVAGAIGSFMMALENHDYSEATTHKVRCVKMGCVVVQKVAASGGGKKGQPVMVSDYDFPSLKNHRLLHTNAEETLSLPRRTH